MSKTPKAVLISDVHYNINTLALADASMRMAIATANELKVPLIVAGDLHDTKANLRGECVNAMIETFKLCDEAPFVLVGNHDKLSESSMDHSLSFLGPYAQLIQIPVDFHGFSFIPYQHRAEDAVTAIEQAQEEVIVMHQGLKQAASGDYIQDHSAISEADIQGRRIISGHYHTRQDIGTFSYIGNPYSLTFGEANDPEKGFQILNDDTSLTFVPTNLRRHRAYNLDAADLIRNIAIVLDHTPIDLVWVKIKGTREELAKLNRAMIVAKLNLPSKSRIDFSPVKTETDPVQTKNLNKYEAFEALVNGAQLSPEAKTRINAKWKALV